MFISADVRLEDSDTRDFVFRKLSKATDEKVVAIASPIGYVGIDVHVHHVINAAGKGANCLLLFFFG